MRRALAAAAVLAATARAARRRDPRSPGHALLVNGGLTAAALPFLVHESRERGDARLLWILLAGQQLRTCSAFVHHRVLTTVYDGVSDLEEYHPAGERIAAALRAGRLGEAAELMRTYPWDTTLPGPVSTNLMRLLSGAVYAAVGPSPRSAMVVFSWLGFGGLFLFQRAFAIAVPEGRHRDYAASLFLSPSLAYWTSGMAKEPWMTLGFGTAALGAARTLSGSPRSGVPLGLLGIAASAAMRMQVGGRFGMTIGSELRAAGDRTHLGGSRFSPPRAESPLQAPLVAASVLFRPHPGEAHNAVARAAAADASLLLLVTLVRARWLAAAAASVPRQPYVAVAAGATGVVVAYLARVANFGMLSRQRTPVLPFYLVLLAVPPRSR